MPNDITKKDVEEYLRAEVLDEDVDALNKEYTKDFDPMEVFDVHKEELKDLIEIMETLETVNKEYDPKKHDLEAVERAYLYAISLTLRQARRFNPLSTYGRDMLRDAVTLRDEYESMYAPLVTGIDDTNVDDFFDLIPGDLLEEIYVGRAYGVGVFRTAGNDTKPAGAAVYHFIELPEEEESGPVIDVVWFYVDEDNREDQVGDQMLGELIALLSEAGGSSLIMSVPADEEYLDAYMTLFSEWRFSVATGIDRDFLISLSDITDTTVFDKYKSAKTLSDLELEKRDRVIRTGLSEMPELLDFYDEIWDDYYDYELSFYTGPSTEPTGLLLTHVRPSGKIEVEYCEGDYERLYASAIKSAYVKFGDEGMFSAVAFDEKEEEFLESLVSEQKGVLTVDGVLIPPEDDVRDEDIARIFSAIESAEPTP